MLRRKDLDVLKGFSIIFVILYHLGFVESGYLGVDVFLLSMDFLLSRLFVKKSATETSNI